MKKHNVPMNKRRLGAIARWLEAGAPEKKHVIGFNMNHGILYKEKKATGKEMLGCGTTCCIAGAAVQFFNKPVEFADKQLKLGYLWIRGIDAGWCYVEDEARELLGLMPTDSEALFVPKEGAIDCERKEISPAWAARCIRKFIKTGTVDWVGTKEA